LKLVKRIVTDLFEIIEPEGLESLREHISKANELTSAVQQRRDPAVPSVEERLQRQAATVAVQRGEVVCRAADDLLQQKAALQGEVSGDWSATFQNYME
jgi:hypothetical protein